MRNMFFSMIMKGWDESMTNEAVDGLSELLMSQSSLHMLEPSALQHVAWQCEKETSTHQAHPFKDQCFRKREEKDICLTYPTCPYRRRFQQHRFSQGTCYASFREPSLTSELASAWVWGRNSRTKPTNQEALLYSIIYI